MHVSDISFEFTYGACAFNLTNKMQLGLAYEKEVESYDKYILRNQTPHCNLNLPIIGVAVFTEN